MAIKAPRKRSGYAAWILTKVFDELTGNYYRDPATQNQAKPLMGESARRPDENIPRVDEFDRFDDFGPK